MPTDATEHSEAEELTPAEPAAAATTSGRDGGPAVERRLQWAGVVVLAVALFAGGYAIGKAAADDAQPLRSPVAIDDIDLPPFLRDLDREFLLELDPGRFDGPRALDRLRRDLACDIVGEDANTLTLVCDGVRSTDQGRPREVPGDDGDVEERRSDEPGFLGVSIVETPRGVVIAEVVEGSPAARAGIEVDDVIVSLNGTEIDSAEQLSDRIAAAGAGAEVSITVRRFDARITVQVELTERPD